MNSTIRTVTLASIAFVIVYMSLAGIVLAEDQHIIMRAVGASLAPLGAFFGFAFRHFGMED